MEKQKHKRCSDKHQIESYWGWKYDANKKQMHL